MSRILAAPAFFAVRFDIVRSHFGFGSRGVRLLLLRNCNHFAFRLGRLLDTSQPLRDRCGVVFQTNELSGHRGLTSHELRLQISKRHRQHTAFFGL
jgi:hypothetical protein